MSDHRKESKPKKEIFISHGKDQKSLDELKEMLTEFGLKPVVLSEQPSGGKTIVEKLEEYSNVGYAFVILTPDDLGGFLELGSKWSRPARLKRFISSAHPRPRQNVVLEFGYFVGKLGRSKVTCLLKKPVEQPSDMQGIVYIPFNDSIKEIRAKIWNELEIAGYKLPDKTKN
jgi:predicted nucleotide-binding protein